LDVVLRRFVCRPARVNMRAVDVSVDAVPKAREQEAVPRRLQRQEHLEGEPPPSVGVEGLVHTDLWSTLKCTRASIVEQVEHFPKFLHDIVPVVRITMDLMGQ
jgi:hypothetical protein